MPDPGPASVDDAVRTSLDAYASLQEVAEQVEDEWMYIQELAAAHTDRLESIAARDGDRDLDPEAAAAVAAACAEVRRITDPHRAIDWLSTFPSVIAVALGEEP